jgi:AraC family transcriptional regulator
MSNVSSLHRQENEIYADGRAGICTCDAEDARTSRIPVIPLLSAMAPDDARRSPAEAGPRLIVTVSLDGGRAHLRWLPHKPNCTPMTRALTPECLAALPVHDGLEGQCLAVKYVISRRALDNFSESHSLSFVPRENRDSHVNCPVLLGLTHLLLSALSAPHLSNQGFIGHFGCLFCTQVVHLTTSETASEAPFRGGLSTWQKRRVQEILSDPSGDNIRLHDIAQQCSLSVSHFARSFKTSFGIPLHRWVINQRVERSKRLLLDSNEALLEIAFQAGFCDQASFNRTFAKFTGMSPGRWRKQFKESITFTPLHRGGNDGVNQSSSDLRR